MGDMIYVLVTSDYAKDITSVDTCYLLCMDTTMVWHIGGGRVIGGLDT